LTPTDPDPKAALRRIALARRRTVGPELRSRLTGRLVHEGLRLARLWAPAVVSGFHPIREEPDVLGLLGALDAEGFGIALPVVTGRGTHLDFRLWRPGEPTALGPMGIPEPLSDAPSVDPDLLFTPLAAFDRRGRRLGYGAGYYDRSLARLRALKPVRAVGVAYGVCEVASVPYEVHDELLDAIVTEQETIFVSER
jgi:5-formyltetrahydrofolate cyclo-ligase